MGDTLEIFGKEFTEVAGIKAKDDNGNVLTYIRGGSDNPILIQKTIVVNGTYNASNDNADGYSSVTVNVSNTYTSTDEGKVVSSGVLVAQSSDTVTANGTVDTTLINSLTVDVNSTLDAKSITANGTYNATDDNLDGYSSVTVNVSAPEVTIIDGGSITQELQPGTIYHFTATTLTSLTITLANNSSNAQYHFDFISPATAPTLNLPSSVSMANHFTVEPNSKFEIDICNNLGVFAEWVY